MTYVVLLSEAAKAELAIIKKSGDKSTLKKIANLLVELQEHPRTGTGQVERLKHYVFEETWSRRINKQYRMIYEIHDTEVYVAVISLRSQRRQVIFSECERSPCSQEKMEEQTQAIKPSLKRKEKEQCHKTIGQIDKTTDSIGSHYSN